MPRVRVLVVDDSVVVRRILSEELAKDAEIHVIGTAASGPIALAKVEQLNPDVVTLDVAMEGMSGLETLARIRESHPGVRAVMFSALTGRGATATVEALLLGASDYVAKPSGAVDSAADVVAVRDELVRKIKALAPRHEDHAPSAPGAITLAPIANTSTTGVVDVVAIGVSTGGPNALMEVLPRFPRDLPVPVLVVQHMPPVFTQLLANGLSDKSSLRVEEALPGGLVAPGVVWIAPGDHHMAVAREADGVRLRLSATDPPENSCRPSVDVLFRSVARVFGPRSLAVVMTGMGQDGLVGCEHVKEAGGQVVVQDEATSVVWGMPGFVARSGLADAVVPLPDLAAEILRRVGLARSRSVEAR